jgi:hypothetical protein
MPTKLAKGEETDRWRRHTSHSSPGTYHMIPHFICYHATTSYNSNLKGSILKKMLAFTTCVSTNPIIYRTKFDIYIEKLKKINQT